MSKSTLPWIKKYQPLTSKEIVGQESSIKKVKDYIQNYKSKKKKAVFIYGPVGCGKTSSIYAIAKDLNLELIEINASDVRNKKSLNERLGPALQQMSLFSKGKIILVDELEGVSGTKDRGGISALIKLIKSSNFPLILAANDVYNDKFRSLRKKCELVEYNELNYKSIFSFLKTICEKENITYDEIALKSISRRCGGDLRGAIIDLQIVSVGDEITREKVNELSPRAHDESIPQALIKIFKNSDPKIATTAFNNTNIDLQKAMSWIDHNLPKEYTKKEDLASAYDWLSKADIMNRRIRRWQHWRYLVYVNSYITAGIAVSKSQRYKSFVKYAPTNIGLKIWISRNRYAKRKSIALKSAEKTHSSLHYAIQNFVPYAKVIVKKNKIMGAALSHELELNDDEVKWLKK